jgi:hypothetical protein
MTDVEDEGVPPHPGLIEWVDGASGQVLREDSADEFPDSLRFAPDAQGGCAPSCG